MSIFSIIEYMQIEKNEIHIWTTDLTISDDQEQEKLLLLSSDEINRANRFQFPSHKKNFIAGRSMLRLILSTYLKTKPQEIHFHYSDKKKPYLSSNPIQLQFNLSHSHTLAIYALTIGSDIGVDIEKIQDNYNPRIAEKFFTTQENEALLMLQATSRADSFYKMWTFKEAMIKASGTGISSGLFKFSVSLHDNHQIIVHENKSWSLIALTIHHDYKAAVATNQLINKISYWQYFNNTPMLQRVDTL